MKLPLMGETAPKSGCGSDSGGGCGCGSGGGDSGSATTSSRRNVMLGGAMAAAGLAAVGFSRNLLAAEPPKEPAVLKGTGERQARWGMVIDLDKCTGCGACVASCREENNVPVTGAEGTGKDQAIFWMDMLRITEGSFPEMRTEIIPTPCNHCENPPCVKVCPVGATYQNDEGIVAQIWGRCIGCRFCTVACPYTRRYFNWAPPVFTPEEVERLNPDVATRPVGVVEKCTFCHHRIRKLRESVHASKKPITDADVQHLPACSQSCPTQAITFGDLNDPESSVSQLAENPRAFRLQEELGTSPKVVYLRRQQW
jgi:molybdopterin-containing oxidoreductase family iron-sulfur binding subunit